MKTLALLLALTSSAYAIDTDGFSLKLSPDQRDYVKSLKNNDGVPCCDDADGVEAEVRDTELGATSGFDVRINGQWLPADKSALIQPNKLGVNRVWWADFGDGPFIRCLLVGAGS
jgi:hypothetical protein